MIVVTLSAQKKAGTEKLNEKGKEKHGIPDPLAIKGGEEREKQDTSQEQKGNRQSFWTSKTKKMLLSPERCKKKTGIFIASRGWIENDEGGVWVGGIICWVVLVVGASSGPARKTFDNRGNRSYTQSFQGGGQEKGESLPGSKGSGKVLGRAAPHCGCLERWIRPPGKKSVGCRKVWGAMPGG